MRFHKFGLFSILSRFTCRTKSGLGLSRHPTPRHFVSIVLLSALLYTVYFVYYTIYVDSVEPVREVPQIFTRCGEMRTILYHPNKHSTSARLRFDAKALVLLDETYGKLGQSIITLIEANRMKYKTEFSLKNMPILTSIDRGKYAVIIFENFNRYLQMDKWNRELLDKYCREYNVGVIGFMKKEDTLIRSPVRGFPLTIDSVPFMQNYALNDNSSVLRILRPEKMNGTLPISDWVTFQSSHQTYVPIAYAESFHEQLKPNTFSYYDDINAADVSHNYTVVVHDVGIYDGIQRVLFGNSLDFWIHKPLMLDAISCLSHGRLSTSLKRYIQIDIDDIFVGKSGQRMLPSDVHALIGAQARLQRHIAGFRFNLGFSGKFFHAGSRWEDAGDDLLIEMREHFWWFGHMWSHSQPHLYSNLSELVYNMKRNKEFAMKHGISTDSGYAVAPHHSGVYPVHEHLYEAWKEVWNIEVTSTEEYPHLRPAHHRRGFIWRNIRVLPRQTCGLFTHTLILADYPNGPERLQSSINGGELFQLFINNKANIFMTHMSNYALDRLGLYTFEGVVDALRCWTNLELVTVPPTYLGTLYFQWYPDEVDPIWQDPCIDTRHQSIWPPHRPCPSPLPNTLILGPQKTGSTALAWFLNINPDITTNKPNEKSFEEMQFFSGENYLKGLDWYMSYFSPNATSVPVVIEKSATYFSSHYAAVRARALLPAARLIIILVSPISRAYSWYQHQVAHSDPTTSNHTFLDVITGVGGSDVQHLRARCLTPGHYATHLEHWLAVYPPSQVLVVDGEVLRREPIQVLSQVMDFLHVTAFPYHLYLRYDVKKGFYCIRRHPASSNTTTTPHHSKCLGSSKGRHYPPIDRASQLYLKAYYKDSNQALHRLLNKLGVTIPHWLKHELATVISDRSSKRNADVTMGG